MSHPRIGGGSATNCGTRSISRVFLPPPPFGPTPTCCCRFRGVISSVACSPEFFGEEVRRLAAWACDPRAVAAAGPGAFRFRVSDIGACSVGATKTHDLLSVAAVPHGSIRCGLIGDPGSSHPVPPQRVPQARAPRASRDRLRAVWRPRGVWRPAGRPWRGRRHGPTCQLARSGAQPAARPPPPPSPCIDHSPRRLGPVDHTPRRSGPSCWITVYVCWAVIAHRACFCAASRRKIGGRRFCRKPRAWRSETETETDETESGEPRNRGTEDEAEYENENENEKQKESTVWHNSKMDTHTCTLGMAGPCVAAVCCIWFEPGGSACCYGNG